MPVIARYLASADDGFLTNFGVLTQILVLRCSLNTNTALSVSHFGLDWERHLPGQLGSRSLPPAQVLVGPVPDSPVGAEVKYDRFVNGARSGQ